MYCPQCGSNQSEGKRFCTICGTNLQVVTQALTGQLQLAYHPPAIPHPYEIERQRETAKGVKLAIIGGGFVALKFFTAIFSGGSFVNPLSVIGFILLAIGISKLVAYRPIENTVSQHPQLPTSTPQPVFSSMPNTGNLHAPSRPAPSVTEDETRHLPHRTR
ncbi:MAG: hypothetical protein ACREEM_10820 [Blastocatellia bacterium]